MNPFKQYVEEHMPRPVLRRMRSAQERAKHKALNERDLLFALWRKHNQKLMEELRQGPYGAVAAELITFLHSLTPELGDELFALVQSGPWREADDDTRYLVLRLVDARIASVREHYGMAPFDSSLPELGEEPTLFESIKNWMESVT